MSEGAVRVLVVDDDPSLLSLVERTLRSEGFSVRTASSPIGVTNVVCEFAPHLVLLDVNIPALSGPSLIAISRRWAQPGTRFVLYSSADESRLRSLAREFGADGWLSKSVTGTELVTRLRGILR
jgi:two-component system, OmpR family, response regulator